MQLQSAIQNVFDQLSDSLLRLEGERYIQPLPSLSQATIGQHVRHIIELFTCLEEGYAAGVVNYEKRKRDRRIETDLAFALECLTQITHGLGKQNRPLLLEASYSEDLDEIISIDSNYYRELAYNLEHTIHHMALIKVGILEMNATSLPDSYGVASSTLKYRKSCAQ